MDSVKGDGHDRSGGEGSFPTKSGVGPIEEIGTEIGPYKLLNVLGEGGFAIVYLAEQKHPIRRQVALKLIKPGMDSKQVIARFEAERQALALLDHPNIAHVLDAGATDAGRPYFVLELVKGLPITQYCDHHKLSIEERLELFRKVCEAVQHAHQKGIIHRDIKPSNILVPERGGKPVPLIIDFGIAKAMSQPLTERTLFTEQGQFVGTPEYMSPEQAGLTIEDIDTRSDIYSLGVLLYELLTGTLPFSHDELAQAGFAEIQRIIRETEPPRPSTRLSGLGDQAKKIAEHRRTEIRTLTKRIQKELEWIPLKAMRKERDRRYKTASELADDVRNYLNGDPLIAGPESTTYRLKKTVKRHQALVTGIAAVLIVLVVGITVSTIFAIGQAHERQRAEEAERLAEQTLQEVRTARDAEEMERKRAQDALEKEAKAREETERQAEINKAALDFIKDDLLGSIAPERTKSQDVSIRHVLDAASESVGDKFKNSPLTEASIRWTLGLMFLHLGAYERAEHDLERSLQIYREKSGEESRDTLGCMNNLASAYRVHGRYGEAELLLSKALEIGRRVLREDDPWLLNLLVNLVGVYRGQNRYNEAETLLTAAIEIDPENANSRRWRGHIYALKDEYDLAIADFTKAISIDPADTYAHHRRGSIYSRKGQYDLAIADFTAAIEIDPNDPDLPWRRGRAYAAKGDYGQAVLDFENATPVDPKDLRSWQQVLYEDSWGDRLVPVLNSAIISNPDAVQNWYYRGCVRLDMGQGDHAIADLKTAIKLAPENPTLSQIHERGLWSFSVGELIGRWKFDEIDGPNVPDLSGNGLTARLVGTATVVEDTERGPVLSLDGEGGYVDCGDDPVFNIRGAITITAWIKVKKLDINWQAIVTKGDTFGGWRLQRDIGNDSIEFACAGVDAASAQYGVGDLHGTIPVDDGKWHHVAGVYNGNQMCVYVDGVLDVHEDASGYIRVNDYPVLIGENAMVKGRNWDGLIDDVRIYSRALNEDEINALCGDSGSSRYWCAKGLTCYRRRDYDLAASAFTSAIEIAPSDPNLYRYRGLTYGRKGDYDQAIFDFQDAMELEPNNFALWETVYEEFERSEAAAFFSRAIELDPNFLKACPPRASAPDPYDGESLAGTVDGTELSWIPARDAVAYKVYFGSDPNSLVLLSSVEGAMSIRSPELHEFEEYCWRVDVERPNGLITKGDLWKFLIGGLVGWWKFDGNARDSSENANHGTEDGNPTYVAGRFGHAISFDGDGDRVEVPATVAGDPELYPAQSISVSAWIRTTMPPKAFSSLIRHEFHFTPLQTYPGNGSAVAFADQDASRALRSIRFDWSQVNDGAWHHCAVTYQNGIHEIWIDGVRIASEDYGSYPLWTRQDQPWVFGGRERGEGGGEYYTGALDDVRIYSYALSEEEIEALWDGSPQDTEAGQPARKPHGEE